jgi:hypothetical protein
MNNEDRFRNESCQKIWAAQVLPKFREAGLSAEQIDAAQKMFRAGFDAGWESLKAFQMQEFIRENQKQKVHLA